MRRHAAAATVALAALLPAAAQAASSATLEVAPVDGGPRTLVSRLVAFVTEDRPRWSADGAALTLVGTRRAGRESGMEVLRLPATSSPPESSTPLRTEGFDTSLSPDGTVLAELTDSGLASGRGGVVLRDLATGAVRAAIPQWAEGDDLYEEAPTVCWSSDGRRAAVAVAERRGGSVHVIDVPSGRTLLRRSARLGAPAGSRCFAPDGRRLLLRGENRLVVVDAETGGARTLPAWGRLIRLARWSPDGGRIAIGTDTDLAIVDAATGWGPSHRTGSALIDVAWSPDGAALAYTLRRGDDDLGDDQQAGLFVASADRLDAPRALVVPRVSELGGFAWSPDGTRIAFTTSRYDR